MFRSVLVNNDRYLGLSSRSSSTPRHSLAVETVSDDLPPMRYDTEEDEAIEEAHFEENYRPGKLY